MLKLIKAYWWIPASLALVLLPESSVTAVRLACMGPFHRVFARSGVRRPSAEDAHRFRTGDVLPPVPQPRQDSESAVLRRTVAALQSRLTVLSSQLVRERRQHGLTGKLDELEVSLVTARIVERSPDWDRKIYTLDRGTADGVETGCGLVAGGALCGVVVSAGRYASHAAGLLEQGVRIPARVARTGQCGMCEPTEDGTSLMLKYVSTERAGAVARGDWVVTSSAAFGLPGAIAIGRVSSCRVDAGSVFYALEVQPEERLEDLEEVLVVKRLRREEERQ